MLNSPFLERTNNKRSGKREAEKIFVQSAGIDSSPDAKTYRKGRLVPTMELEKN